MKYRCVSYPNFEPNHTWLRQVLLLVDEVHRIIPAKEPDQDSDDLKRLMECCEGAVHRCSPQGYVDIPQELARLFGKALDQPQFAKPATAKKIRSLLHTDGRVEVFGWEYLHVDKIGAGVRQELEKRNMLRNLTGDGNWPSVPRGVGDLVVGMVADQIALKKGFDAMTDHPLAFALNALYACAGQGSAHEEGIVASMIASVHVPRQIALLSPKDYGELRRRYAGARCEFARLARELKNDARLDRISDPGEFRRRIDEISEYINAEMRKYRQSKAATKFNDWIPLFLTTLVPVAATCVFGPVPGLLTGGFTFTVNTVAKLTKKTNQFRYPKVLETLCGASDFAWQKEVRALS